MIDLKNLNRILAWHLYFERVIAVIISPDRTGHEEIPWAGTTVRSAKTGFGPKRKTLIMAGSVLLFY